MVGEGTWRLLFQFHAGALDHAIFLNVALDEGYIEGTFARWDDLAKAVRDRSEIRSEFTQMILQGSVSRGNQEWQAGCEYQGGKVSIQASGTEVRWQRTTKDALALRVRSVDRKRAWPLAVARGVSFGAVAAALSRDWLQMLVGHFPPLSLIALLCFVLVMALPYWVLRPVAYFDEKIEGRIADLLPWVTLVVSVAKLLELIWPLLR